MAYNKGERIGDYEIVDVLGAGGMGKVYKVRNVISERVEAMKVLLPNLESDPDLADRFMREIKVQASLQHPNIAALHTALRVNNQLVMLIEFVEGVTVEQQLRSGPIPVQKAKYLPAKWSATLGPGQKSRTRSRGGNVQNHILLLECLQKYTISGTRSFRRQS